MAGAFPVNGSKLLSRWCLQFRRIKALYKSRRRHFWQPKYGWLASGSSGETGPDAWARFKTRTSLCAKGWLPAHPLPSRLPFNSLQLGWFFPPQVLACPSCRIKDQNKSQWLCFHLTAAPPQFPSLLAPDSPSLGCSRQLVLAKK